MMILMMTAMKGLLVADIRAGYQFIPTKIDVLYGVSNHPRLCPMED
jgi:hypothetical protein